MLENEGDSCDISHLYVSRPPHSRKVVHDRVQTPCVTMYFPMGYLQPRPELQVNGELLAIILAALREIGTLEGARDGNNGLCSPVPLCTRRPDYEWS